MSKRLKVYGDASEVRGGDLVDTLTFATHSVSLTDVSAYVNLLAQQVVCLCQAIHSQSLLDVILYYVHLYKPMAAPGLFNCGCFFRRGDILGVRGS